jgi:sigma-B regulation protein RsbU (phosphoserine phosphatase)
MRGRRLADTASPARRRQAVPSLPLPPDDTGRSALDLLLRSWPGRLFIVSLALKFVVALLRLVVELPPVLRVVNTAATIGLAFSVLFFATRLVFLVQRRLLWRVRRKLILSYIFIGVVPVLLVIVFFLLGGMFLSWSVSAYLFRDGYESVIRNADLVAESAAAEIGRVPRTAPETIERVQRNGERSLQYRELSVEFVPTSGKVSDRIAFGRWGHLPAPPETVPRWVQDARPNGFSGTIAMPANDSSGDVELIVRSIRRAGAATAPVGWVIVDVPLDDAMLNRLHDVTGVRAGAVTLSAGQDETLPIADLGPGSPTGSNRLAVFGQTVTSFDSVVWPSGERRLATVTITFKVNELYRRLSEAQSLTFRGRPFGALLMLILIVVAVLFLIIDTVALIMGMALARSITSSIHELFMGTERVRQGDFSHRIKIPTKDQLGELADSFNQMTGSIENLMQTAAEKKRMEEELRIARHIQMSLLPRGPIDMQGLGVTALCVPAREVGGDYYDFFPLGHERVGVLIADVSGKGTSAALYMAELKGLVLSLSQIYQSPRQLLIEVNRIISDNLDSRSFITMTYVVLDLANQVMTFARAGHTPLLYLHGPLSPRRGTEILTPNGMVLGLRIDGAAAKFAELLEEEQMPVHVGDVIVLYTDGITEAMNDRSDLFGENRLSRIVEEHGHLESGELRERILREIEAFVGNADQHDDMTMILMKVEQVVAARVAV